MKLRHLILLLILSAAAVLGQGRVQLRYQPEPQTTWLTEGRLTVKNQLGAEAPVEEHYQLAWEDQVLSRDAFGTVTQERRVRTWEGSAEGNLAPAESFQLSVSKFGEQKLSAAAPTALDQPALFPTRNVAVGETWPVEQTVKTVVPVGASAIPVETHTYGTGKLVHKDGTLAVVEFALQVDSAGSTDWAQTTSKSTVRWTMNLDLASGVALSQKTESGTEQTVTILSPEKAVYPSRTGTVLELSTHQK